jgi:vacuolar-type H+-ATPase subunit C/Vma6
VTIPLPDSRVQWFDLVRASIPENFEMLLRTLSFRIKYSVHPVYDFFIRATLERDNLALVIEPEVEI